MKMYFHNEGPARRRLLRLSHIGAVLFGLGEFLHRYEVSSMHFGIYLDHVGQIGDGFIADAPVGRVKVPEWDI